MKKTLAYTAAAQVVLLAIASNAMANQPAQPEQLEEVSVVSSGSMFKMGEVPVHQAKSAVAISREALDAQDVKKADELGRYQAGFASQVFGNDTNTNWFKVRGADVSQAVNGLPTFSYGFFTPYVETFGLEAVEVTKGADSMTFGAAQSGGLINYVTKRAHKDQVGKGEFRTTFGSNNRYGFGADYTGKITSDDSLRYRIVTSVNSAEGEWANTDNTTYYVAPTLEWDISNRTRLSLLTSYQKDKGTPSNNFFPAYGTLVPAANGYLDRSTNLGDPVNDREENEQYSLGYELSHDFGNGLRANSSYRYTHIDNFHRGSYAFSSVDASGNVARGTVFNDGKVISHALDNRLSWDFKNEWLKNTVVVGTDYRHTKVDTMYDPLGFKWSPAGMFYATTSTNIYNPQVGWGQTQDNRLAAHNTIKARQLGFYLQNQARLADQFVLGFGVRHDRAKQDEYTSTQTVKSNHTSYSGSLMYEAPFGLNPYISYSESFNLPVGISGDKSLYDPNITRQYEAGVKYLPTWLDGVITVAGFRAKDTGAVIGSKSGTGISTSSADPTYRKGVEIQADVNITPNWNATLAYTYTKSEFKVTNSKTITDLNSVVSMGEKVRNQYIPTNVLSARTAYTFDNGVLNGLTLGVGIRYVGHSVATKSGWNAYSHHRVPSATVVDLMARYQINPNWAVQVNADNVGNRRYVAACDSYCYYGSGSKVTANLSYKF